MYQNYICLFYLRMIIALLSMTNQISFQKHINLYRYSLQEISIYCLSFPWRDKFPLYIIKFSLYLIKNQRPFETTYQKCCKYAVNLYILYPIYKTNSDTFSNLAFQSEIQTEITLFIPSRATEDHCKILCIYMYIYTRGQEYTHLCIYQSMHIFPIYVLACALNSYVYTRYQ